MSMSAGQESPFEVFLDNSIDPQVRGFLHRPKSPSGDGLILTHGAGGNAQMGLLVALAEAFAGAGFTVLRCDLPFRQGRSFGPPRPGGRRPRSRWAKECRCSDEDACSGAGISWRAKLWWASGKHASIREKEKQVPRLDERFASESLVIARNDSSQGWDALSNGLLLLSYPLHAPGQARPASHSTLAEASRSHSVCGRYARSIRVDRGDRGCSETHSSEDEIARHRRSGPRSRV